VIPEVKKPRPSDIAIRVRQPAEARTSVNEVVVRVRQPVGHVPYSATWWPSKAPVEARTSPSRMVQDWFLQDKQNFVVIDIQDIKLGAGPMHVK
jgi:hypothetical protein